MTAWSHLYRPLRDGLPAGHYHPAKSLIRIEQDAASITAHFADGTHATGDLVVAADGARSAARAQFAPQTRPEYAGYIAWRALVPEAEIDPADRDLLFERNAFCFPEGTLEVSYAVPGRDGDLRVGHRDYNIVWYRPVTPAHLADMNTDVAGQRYDAIPSPRIRADVTAEVKNAAERLLAPSIAKIFVRAEQPIFQPIYDLVSPRIAFGRLALIGDAAFVARPHVGAGVTKAALDSACLVDALAAHGDVGAALTHFDRVRRRDNEWIVARGRKTGEAIAVEGSPALSADGKAARAAFAWNEYLALPGEIRAWAAPALSRWVPA
jgi:2-polyprenyl-6-methoxyphenol hydroxylase-like FAD-dependent oxidoreductase